MPNGEGSSVVRRQLGRKLKRLREDANKTIKSVNDAKLFSPSKLARIEAGKLAVKVGDVWALCRFYGASDEVTDALAALSYGTLDDSWWEDDSDAVPPWLRMYVGLEATCSFLGSYHPEVVHGLFQTEAYARAVLVSNGPKSQEVLDRQLQLRKERQAAALQDRNRQLLFVLGPAAIAIQVVPPDVLADQVAHLREVNAQDGVDIRVLPVTAGAHPGMSGSFTYMDFDDPDDPAVVYVESLTGARYLDADRHVRAYRNALTQLQTLSKPIEEITP